MSFTVCHMTQIALEYDSISVPTLVNCSISQQTTGRATPPSPQSRPILSLSLSSTTLVDTSSAPPNQAEQSTLRRSAPNNCPRGSHKSPTCLPRYVLTHEVRWLAEVVLMGLQKRPYSAVSVMIDQMTNASVPENDLGGLPELVDVVNIQDTGPSEAARALRKKLKYGNVHRQLRALTILDALIENAGPQFKRSFADEPLLERLRFCASAPTSDPEVRKKCDELFRGWASMYKNTRGMERVTKLYKVGQPVQTKRPSEQPWVKFAIPAPC